MPKIKPLSAQETARLTKSLGKEHAASYIRSLTTTYSKAEIKGFKEFLSSTPWDSNGHALDIKEFLKDLEPNLNGIFHILFDVYQKHTQNHKADLSKELSFSRCVCHHCGADVLNWNYTAKSGFKCVDACTCPSNIYSFEINIPSGKMVVANDLRSLVKLTGDVGNINYIKGCRDTSFAYASAGMAHAFVGNTCPAIYKKSDTEFYVGNRRPKGADAPKLKGLRQVASICTDLWWYSIMDYDWFVTQAKAKPDQNQDIVKCTPGRYRFDHLYYQNRSDSNVTEIYTVITHIGPATKTEDPFEKLSYSVEEIIADKLPSEYYQSFKTKTHPNGHIYRAIDQLMCVCGNGSDYHPNGWWGFKPFLPEDRKPAPSLPEITGKFRWYPLSEYSVVHQVAYKKVPVIHPSFIALTYKVLTHMLSDEADVSGSEQHPSAIKNFKKLATAAMVAFKKNHKEYVV